MWENTVSPCYTVNTVVSNVNVQPPTALGFGPPHTLPWPCCSLSLRRRTKNTLRAKATKNRTMKAMIKVTEFCEAAKAAAWLPGLRYVPGLPLLEGIVVVVSAEQGWAI